MPALELLRRVARFLRHPPLRPIAGRDRMDIRAPFPNHSGSPLQPFCSTSQLAPIITSPAPRLQGLMPPVFSAAPPQLRRPRCATRRFLLRQPRPRPRQLLSRLVRYVPRQSVASHSLAQPQPACLLTCAP
uniref:Uncharacterized protein n=1 Tax=Setaria viridis TaxID=4556 RepID=A0A4V6D5B7_SETVI|nr:hypothetical protein SEVIR_6G124775v2 [Setaria viridis]